METEVVIGKIRSDMGEAIVSADSGEKLRASYMGGCFFSGLCCRRSTVPQTLQLLEQNAKGLALGLRAVLLYDKVVVQGCPDGIISAPGFV